MEKMVLEKHLKLVNAEAIQMVHNLKRQAFRAFIQILILLFRCETLS